MVGGELNEREISSYQKFYKGSVLKTLPNYVMRLSCWSRAKPEPKAVAI
ncbi:hypothetical protein DSLASN_35260 [Desulfoluna limicola]|uniref:Uncharacterized protein n=1 Tax=Desulfoluna limicola TaxID=2810562 RepID=A0ABM7PL05_9BACT|nr:hypothetical protein DSLASN_35260 [Desulfoluna limicola]